MNCIVKAMTMLAVSSLLFSQLSACSSNGYSRPTTSYGASYGRHYGSPWGGYHRPVYVIDGGGIGSGIDHDRPIATPLPEMGAPDIGGPGMDSMDMDIGFDW